MSRWARTGTGAGQGALNGPVVPELERFFASPRAAAVLKHSILGGYLVPFASKVGSTSAGGRVVVVDVYAGAGRYDDGKPGSPALIAGAARSLRGRRVECFFVEKNRANYTKLCGVLDQVGRGDVACVALHGTVEQHLDELLARAAGTPLFLFLDPFGLGLPFDVISGVFTGRPAGRHVPATEVLFRFDASAVRRIRGVLHAEDDYPARAGQLAALDRAAGGSWWRDEDDRSLTMEAYTDWFMQRLLEKLGRDARCAGWVIDVKQRPEQQPAYYLVFLTRHRHGLEVFADAVSRAQAKWRRAVFDEAMDEDERKNGGPSLFDREELFADEENLLRARWEQQIARNVRVLLQTHSRFVVREHVPEVFRDVLGLARETHLRAALKQLAEAGVTSSDSRGPRLWEKVVIAATRP